MVGFPFPNCISKCDRSSPCETGPLIMHSRFFAGLPRNAVVLVLLHVLNSRRGTDHFCKIACPSSSLASKPLPLSCKKKLINPNSLPEACMGRGVLVGARMNDVDFVGCAMLHNYRAIDVSVHSCLKLCAKSSKVQLYVRGVSLNFIACVFFAGY